MPHAPTRATLSGLGNIMATKRRGIFATADTIRLGGCSFSQRKVCKHENYVGAKGGCWRQDGDDNEESVPGYTLPCKSGSMGKIDRVQCSKIGGMTARAMRVEEPQDEFETQTTPSLRGQSQMAEGTHHRAHEAHTAYD